MLIVDFRSLSLRLPLSHVLFLSCSPSLSIAPTLFSLSLSSLSLVLYSLILFSLPPFLSLLFSFFLFYFVSFLSSYLFLFLSPLSFHCLPSLSLSSPHFISYYLSYPFPHSLSLSIPSLPFPLPLSRTLLPSIYIPIYPQSLPQKPAVSCTVKRNMT